MKIIIDIPEELYDRFGHEYREENLISKYTSEAILEAFCKSTPLPAEYGNRDRLADALDKIRAEIEQLHYHPKLDFIKHDEVVDMALEIIDRQIGDKE